MRSNKFHLGIALGVLTPIATVLLYALLRGWRIWEFGSVDGIYKLPIAAAEEARPIDLLFDAHFVLIAFLFALIMVPMLYSIVRFRRRPGEEGDGEYVHGNTALEITWTVLPLFLVVGFGIVSSLVLADITQAQPNALVVEVYGQQWAWSFAYPDADGATAGELVLPVGEPVELHMRSLDVLHSFWVPEFRVKQDLLPGPEDEFTLLRFTPSVTGNYTVRCAEICGFSHAYMNAPVRVVSATEYERFLQNIADVPDVNDLAGWGAKHYVDYGCQGCHSLDGTDLIGPTWLGIWQREEQLADGTTIIVDEEYLRNSILNPNLQIVAGYPEGQMPENYGERFEGDPYNRDEVVDLIEFMKTLDE